MTKSPSREEIESWKWPRYFEPFLRPDKCKPRSGETRKLRGLLKRAKEQNIVIIAELDKFEDYTKGRHYVYNLETKERLTPKFRTASECLDILADFLETA